MSELIMPKSESNIPSLVSRRTFVALSVGAALHAAGPAALAQRSSADVITQSNLGAYTQGLLSEKSLQKMIGTNFWVELPEGGRTMMTLRAVTSGKPQILTSQQTADVTQRLKTINSQTRRLTSFVAVFYAEGQAIPQDSYVVDSPFLGRFALFISPGAGGNTYHASFTSFDGATDNAAESH